MGFWILGFVDRTIDKTATNTEHQWYGQNSYYQQNFRAVIDNNTVEIVIEGDSDGIVLMSIGEIEEVVGIENGD